MKFFDLLMHVIAGLTCLILIMLFIISFIFALRILTWKPKPLGRIVYDLPEDEDEWHDVRMLER